jgi:hypothetical protein
MTQDVMQAASLQWVFGSFLVCAVTLLDAWEAYEFARQSCHGESFGTVTVESGREAIWINLGSPALKGQGVN